MPSYEGTEVLVHFTVFVTLLEVGAVELGGRSEEAGERGTSD